VLRYREDDPLLERASQGGGAEHSTSVIAIQSKRGSSAAALGKLGRKVLVWDLDVNYGLTSHFGIPPIAYSGTFHILTGKRVMYLPNADKYRRLTRRPSQEQKGLDERTLMAFQRLFHPS